MYVSPLTFRRGSRLDEVGELAPLSLVKQACNVDGEDDDELLKQYMSSSKEWIETAIHRPIDRYRWTVTYGRCNEGDLLILPMAPVYEIEGGLQGTSVPYQTIDGFQACIAWEDVQRFEVGDEVRLEVVTDWGPLLSGTLRYVFLTLVAEMYRNREATAMNRAVNNVVMLALDKYRRDVSVADQ